MKLASGIYTGAVRHRRFGSVPHQFRFPMFMMYLDLDELPAVFDGTPWFSARRPALAWFRRRDYLDGRRRDGGTLREAVLRRVEDHTGVRPRGPVRVLTHLRYFGTCFNPVSLYYVFAPDGERLEHLVAEITNTPWGERHTYIVPAEETSSARVHRHRMRKTFHVSPFLDMDHEYDWRWTRPGNRLAVHMENRRDGERLFDATLALSRTEITPRALNAALVRHPFLSARVVGGIYREALRLWIKRAPFYSHPDKRQPPASPAEPATLRTPR